ncbi:MAG: PQQ-binding-like beta-propeller repeat protein [Pseudomonadota bacterium]
MSFSKLHVFSLYLTTLLCVTGCGSEPAPEPSAPAGPSTSSVELPTQPLDQPAGEHYANTAWPTVHRDGSNSDYVALNPTPNVEMAWHVLDGAALLIGPIIGPEGNLYATTGQGADTSHLHAFDKTGALLWQTAPMQSLDDFDYAAVVSAPIIDADGNLYAGDSNQLWSFTAAGDVRWTASFVEGGGEGFMITPIFTHEGHVGGITSDGVLLVYDRVTGALAYDPMELPGVAGQPSVPAPPGLWGGGFLAEAFVQPLWDVIYGRAVEVANTPAVHPDTGRIFMSATGTTPEQGVLYGIDTSTEGATIAFETPIGAGSGTSPAISPDGQAVYVANEAGVMSAIDTQSGDVIWTAENAQGQASPSIGPDGMVYTFDPVAGDVIAIRGDTGDLKWKRTYHNLAEAGLSRSLVAKREVAINSIITVTDNGLWIAMDLCYLFERGEQNFRQPQAVWVFHLDAETGDVLGSFEAPGSSSAFVTPDQDGNLYMSLGEVTTTISTYGVNPRLPGPLKSDYAPTGGLVAFRPGVPEAD